MNKNYTALYDILNECYEGHAARFEPVAEQIERSAQYHLNFIPSEFDALLKIRGDLLHDKRYVLRLAMYFDKASEAYNVCFNRCIELAQHIATNWGLDVT